MTVSSSSEKNNYRFGAITKKQWEEAAISEWQGASVAEKSTTIPSGIVIRPYYDKTDLPEKKLADISVSQHSFPDARVWFNMPLIPVHSVAEANKEALDSLNSGADGILFELSGDPDPVKLFDKIEFNYCAISFLATDIHPTFFQRFSELAGDRNYDVTQIRGAIFRRNSANRENPVLFKDWSLFHSNGIVQNVQDPNELISSIAQLIFKGVQQVEHSTGCGLNLHEALNSVAFMVVSENDFFIDLCKIKVLRMLWHKVIRHWSYDFQGMLQIHTITAPWGEPSWQPHGNLLRNTTSGMSAVLGGCDALTVLPERYNSVMMRRIALNVSLVLREESHFSKVADPAAGAYFLESLTDELARNAWDKFQQL